ncbi:MAG TPA: hypothetical protein VFB01_18765 [Burkholderiales bacterium]|nr:hypothetical protein [Burkholderiales bacterium]
MTPWRAIADGIAQRAAAAGLDLAHPLNAAWYDDVVEPTWALPDVGRRDALAVLLASSRALWPRFVAALRREPARIESPDPLDDYVGDAVLAAVRPLGERWEVRLAHEPPPRRIAIQRLAHLAGFAFLGSGFLNVHPTFGPWIALRAVVVVDVPGPATRPSLADPCGGCTASCVAARERALAASGGTGEAELRESWRVWLAAREACPVGAAHRYDDAQIRYTYTKDRGVLRALVAS